MRVVLYTQDMEPITVLELPGFLYDMLLQGQHIHVAAPMPLTYASLTSTEIADEVMHIVRIWAEPLQRKGQRSLMLFTDDEVTALMLRSDLLPGQQRGAQEKARENYARGFIDALERLL